MFYKQMSICPNVKNPQKRVPLTDHEHTGENYKEKVTKWDTTRKEHNKKCLVSAFSVQEKT